MAITFRGANANNTNNGTSIFIRADTAGAQNGDVMIVAIGHRGGSGGTISPPSGSWNQIGSQTNSGTALAQARFWKVYDDATDTGNQVFEFGTGSNVKGTGVVLVFDGVDATAPVLGQAAQANASAANIAIPAISSWSDSQPTMLVAIAGKAHSAAHNEITNWTLDASATTASGGGGAAGHDRTSAQHRAVTAASAGATTVVSTTAAVSIGSQLALREEEPPEEPDTITGDFSLEAALRAVRADSVGADAVLRAVQADAFSLDAVLEGEAGGTETGDFSVDASVEFVSRAVWTTPAHMVTITDLQPVLSFFMPSSAWGAMRFEMTLDTADTFDSPDLRTYRTWPNATGWEYHDGSDWQPVPVEGVPTSAVGNEARFTIPDDLTQTTWYRRIRAFV